MFPVGQVGNLSYGRPNLWRVLDPLEAGLPHYGARFAENKFSRPAVWASLNTLLVSRR